MIVNNSTRTDGDKYIPYEKEKDQNLLFFSLEIFQQGLEKIYPRVKEHINGKIAI